MHYALLIYDDESAWQSLSEEERGTLHEEYWAFTEELQGAGAHVSGKALHPVAAAKSVRLRSGERLVVDGPFAETKEQLGGFYLIDADSEEQALEWAAKVPSARLGTIEVRPVVVFDEEAAKAPTETAAA
jgi:hypothetical protein